MHLDLVKLQVPFGALQSMVRKRNRESMRDIHPIDAGKYRLNARKVNPKLGKRGGPGTFASRAAAETLSQVCARSMCGAAARALLP